MLCPHAFCEFFYFTKIFGHLIPAIPVGIVRIDVEESLVGTHAMFHIHLHEDLIYAREFIEVFIPALAIGLNSCYQAGILIFNF